jgi:hypothetical protein
MFEINTHTSFIDKSTQAGILRRGRFGTHKLIIQPTVKMILQDHRVESLEREIRFVEHQMPLLT